MSPSLMDFKYLIPLMTLKIFIHNLDLFIGIPTRNFHLDMFCIPQTKNVPGFGLQVSLDLHMHIFSLHILSSLSKLQYHPSSSEDQKNLLSSLASLFTLTVLPNPNTRPTPLICVFSVCARSEDFFSLRLPFWSKLLSRAVI